MSEWIPNERVYSVLHYLKKYNITDAGNTSDDNTFGEEGDSDYSDFEFGLQSPIASSSVSSQLLSSDDDDSEEIVRKQLFGKERRPTEIIECGFSSEDDTGGKKKVGMEKVHQKAEADISNKKRKIQNNNDRILLIYPFPEKECESLNEVVYFENIFKDENETKQSVTKRWMYNKKN